MQELGAGEIVLNMMNQDGMRKGYDLAQLKAVREICTIPLIASGGAGEARHFLDAFNIGVDGALAASIFHQKLVNIKELKGYLQENDVIVRM